MQCARWDKGDLDALGDEGADDVVLDPAVDGQYVHVPAAVRLGRPAPPPQAQVPRK